MYKEIISRSSHLVSILSYSFIGISGALNKYYLFITTDSIFDKYILTTNQLLQCSRVPSMHTQNTSSKQIQSGLSSWD